MLSLETQQSLQSIGIQADHCQDFASGLKLMQLVNQVFYQGENQALAYKLKVTDEVKTGNNVMNINMIMNHLRKDSQVRISSQIRELKTFDILENQLAMIELIEEVLKHRKPTELRGNSYNNDMQEMSPPREDNQFQNLYFVSSMDKKTHVLDDSLEQDNPQENPQEKVVRKGSYKMLKPKVHTAGKIISEESQRGGFQKTEADQTNRNSKGPLRQILLQYNKTQENDEKDDRDDLNCRKTIPKIYERPPLYKNNVPKPLKSTPKAEAKTGAVTSRRAERQQLLKNIQHLDRQIMEESRSMIIVPNEAPSRKSRKTSRKVVKIDIPETDEKRRKMLLVWLISINLLSANSTKFINQLHQICKDGVVFVEIVNYYKGRGKELYYFREPKRSAELHSNYQKLFNSLNEQINFQSVLLHQFDYFIPEAQPNAFWHLLSCIHQCYNRSAIPRESNLHRYQNSMSRKADRELSRRKNTNQSTSYKEIRFNSSSQKDLKSNSSSVEVPRKETPTPKRPLSRRSQQSLEKSIAPYGLIQNEEPSEEYINRTERGYKDLYLSKFKNVETPHKNRSFSNSSLTRSRAKMSHNSSKKKQARPIVPSINLQMQMKVLNYIQDLNFDQDVSQLFRDPYRNGVLLCSVVKKYLEIDCLASRRPKNIEDCRNNIYTAIQIINNHKQNFNKAYESYVQDLLKGEKTLLYGLIWELIREDSRGNKSSSFSICNKKGEQDVAVTWIRSVERCYPAIGQFRIRSQVALLQAILCTDFLFQYSWFITSKKAITATYEHPVNQIQKESNLKKVLSYLIQNKIIRSDYLWKTKMLLKNQNGFLRELVNDLIVHYQHLYQKEQVRTVNFVKYARREESQSKEAQKEKLETTMANRSTAQPQKPVQQPKVEVEVPWMRKLGFAGSLDLNNGVILCRLLTKLTMKTVQGFKQRPQSRAQNLGNIRRAIKQIPKFKWDEYDILHSDHKRATQIYSFLRDRYKHSYAMKGV